MAGDISILGAGSWGSALAILAAKNGFRVLLWGHSTKHIQRLIADKQNAKYLPNHPFPSNVTLTDDLQLAASFSQIILVAVPSYAFKATLLQLAPHLTCASQIAWASKGFNPNDGLLLHQVVAQVLPDIADTAVLSGPTFALEVASCLPTAVTVASANTNFARQVAAIFHNPYFRTYTSQDLVGVQVGGSVKNILAIASGIADGLGFGANTRAALITRGLQEIIRLGVQLGGKPATFMGLAGLGDLVLTCTDNNSRNRRFGIALGQGKNQPEAIAEIGQEIEGIPAAKEAHLLANKHKIEMPITTQTYRVLYENLQAADAVHNLLARNPKDEAGN